MKTSNLLQTVSNSNNFHLEMFTNEINSCLSSYKYACGEILIANAVPEGRNKWVAKEYEGVKNMIKEEIVEIGQRIENVTSLIEGREPVEIFISNYEERLIAIENEVNEAFKA